MPADDLDLILLERIRAGDSAAWADMIERFEGRLLAFVESRLNNRATSEDVVQETFLGFLISLPNYDPQTPLESFLFAIAAHKLTDVLRRQGRRPTIPLPGSALGESHAAPQANARVASSLMRSKERKGREAEVLRESLKAVIETCLARAEFERLKCMELLFVLGWANKDVAVRLGISEQAVANHKHAVVSKLKTAAANHGLSQTDLEPFGI